MPKTRKRKLLPPDLCRCQTYRPSTWPDMPSFMTLGPVSWSRCENAPTWLAVERKTGGSMCLCDECKQVCASVFPSGVDFQPLGNALKAADAAGGGK